MGQGRVNPSGLVSWIESIILVWGASPEARRAPGWTDEWSYLADQEVAAFARLTPDYDALDDTRSLEIRLKRKGPGRHGERFLYIKFSPSARRLDRPRAWRKLGGILKARDGRQHRRLGLLESSRIIYWNEAAVPLDVRIQIILALVQLRLVSRKDWLYAVNQYVRSFRRFAPQEVSEVVASKLVTNWSFPEDFRAFRKYVSTQIRVELMDAPRESRETSIRKEHLHSRIRAAEAAVGFDDGERFAGDSEIKEDAPQSGTAEAPSVDGAAAELGVSSSYLYKLIKAGEVQSVIFEGRRCIPQIELDRLKGRVALKKLKQIIVSRMVETGVRRESARKRVYRKVRSIDDLKNLYDSLAHNQ